MRQLAGNSKPLALAGAAAAALALMPGLPALPFLGLAFLAGGGAWLRHKSAAQALSAETPSAGPAPEPPIADALRIDALRLELGYGLLAMAGGDAPRLTDQIKGLRRAIAAEMGFVLPPVRIQDNLQLPADSYAIRVKEIEAARGDLRPTKLLAMDPSGSLPDLPGERTVEPAFGLPALWIGEDQRETALLRNLTVVDPASVLTTHLTEVVRDSMAELLSYAETMKLLEELPREQQKLVSDLIPSQISAGAVQRVLQALLTERISLRDLPTILEGIQEACGGGMRAIQTIAGHVRTRLARQISDSHVGPGGYIPLVTLSPEWEAAFSESLVGPPDDRQLAIPPTKLNEFMHRFKAVFDSVTANGEAPVLLCSGTIRAHVRAIVERLRPATPVLAQTEIYSRARIRTLGTI